MTKVQSFFCGLGKFYAGVVLVAATVAVVGSVLEDKAAKKLIDSRDPFSDEFPTSMRDYKFPEEGEQFIPISFGYGHTNPSDI